MKYVRYYLLPYPLLGISNSMQNKHKPSHYKVMFWGLAEMAPSCCMQHSEDRLHWVLPPSSVLKPINFYISSGAICFLVFWKSMGCAVGTSSCWFVLQSLASFCESFPRPWKRRGMFSLLSCTISQALPSSGFCPQAGLSGSLVPLLPKLQNLSFVGVDIMLSLKQYLFPTLLHRWEWPCLNLANKM